MDYFKDKIIWIIGASSGIGEELAKALSKKESYLILSSRNKTALSHLRLKLHHPERHIELPIDLEESDKFHEAFETIKKKYGGLDLMFNNGGISQREEAIDTDLLIDRKIMEINYFGNIALTKVVLPYFHNHKKGHIIVTSSIAGKFGFFQRSAYSASKHALHGYYESIALEGIKHNLTITMLCPGKINTEISTNALHGNGEKHMIMDHNQETGMPVERCVQQILKAVSNKKREILIGNKEIWIVYIKRFFPNLFWKIIQKQKAT